MPTDDHTGECNYKAVKELRNDVHEIQMDIVRIQSKLEHTLQNKHAEALSVAKAIDVKFRWISVTVAIIATIGVLISLTTR